jgi:putative tryptophan/tyrosine transport system substrate-binding protein
MRRRAFIFLTAGAAAWPLAALAQQGVTKRIGVLMNRTADDPEGQTEVAAFRQVLKQLGWSEGDNVRIDVGWGAGDPSLYRKLAAELLAVGPDALLGAGGTVVGALQQQTRDKPIVFVETSDPVNRGLIASLSRPGGNTTGFTLYEFGTSGKWLELLKEIAPSVTRVAVVRDPSRFSGVGELAAIQTVAPSLDVDLIPVDARDPGTIEKELTALVGRRNGGLIVTESAPSIEHRELIIELANRLWMPAVYAASFFVSDGGLISYGPDPAEPYRLAAGYVDRILKGEKPADLPVQMPTKLELVVNLKTAKLIGLAIPQSVQARADEVIE